MSDSRRGKDDFEDFDPDTDFEDAPVPAQSRASGPAKPQGRVDDGDYDDVEAEADAEGGDEGGGPDEAEGAGEAPAQKSLLSRLIVPAGIAAMAGLGGLGAWQMGLLGGGEEMVAQAPPPPPPALVAQAPQLPRPALPQAAAPAAPAPMLPATQPAPMPTFAAPPAPAVAPAPQAAPVQAANSELTAGIAALVEEMRASNRANASNSPVMVEMRSMRDMLSGRFDMLDNRMGQLSQRMDGVDTRLGGLETRVVALETRSAPPPSPPPMASASRPAAPAMPPTASARPAPRVEQAARPAPRPAPRAEAPRPAPRVEQASVSDYRLLGASRDRAMLQTPAGAVIEVELGQRLPNGAVARGFRKDGEDWILVTTSGDVRS